MSIIIEFKITRTFQIFIKESAKAGYRMRRTVQICHPERGSFPKLLYRLLAKAFNASLVSELQKSTKRLVHILYFASTSNNIDLIIIRHLHQVSILKELNS